MNARHTLRIRRALRRHVEAAEGDSVGKGELSIVPLLDVITNLVVFLLATASMVSMSSEVSAELPHSCRGAGCGRVPESLSLTVIVTEHTIRVAGAGGQLAAGCTTLSDGAPTIVRDGHEWDALRRCAGQLHTAFPTEREVRLGADPLVPYEDTIAAMDALRQDESGPLFPEILLTAGVR